MVEYKLIVITTVSGLWRILWRDVREYSEDPAPQAKTKQRELIWQLAEFRCSLG